MALDEPASGFGCQRGGRLASLVGLTLSHYLGLLTRPRKRLLLAIISVLVLIASFLVVEHFRGAWMLKRWKTRMAAQGEELDIDRLAPATLPPDINGLPQVLWTAGLLGSLPPDLIPPVVKFVAPRKCVVIHQLNEWHTRTSRNTNAIITWAKVAEPLAFADGTIQATLDALQSEAFNANLYYRGGFSLLMNHLNRIRPLAQFLSVALLHDLHQGQRDAAFAKLQGLLALPEVQRDEPLIISQLVRIGAMHIAFTATWQALQCDGWTDDQLAAMQDAWSRYDFLRTMDKAFAMERAMAVSECERFRNSDQPLSSVFEPWTGVAAAGPTPSLLSWDWVAKMFDLRDRVFTPVWKLAWSRQDELHYCEVVQAVLDAQRRGVASNSGTGAIAAAERIEAIELGTYARLRFIVSRLIIGSLSKPMRRAWLAQTTSELARTAIALKRHELRHGKLPCSLAALVPEFLPQPPIDYMDGQPLRYCLDSDVSFLLYSVGPDGRDDEGDTSPTRTLGTSNWSFQNGRDLVWPQPASEEEVNLWRALGK
jgi:hypothetical protein